MDELVEADVTQLLRGLTPARIALGRTGVSLPTRAWLDFSMAHARARDAVHLPLDVASLQRQLAAIGLSSILLHSAALDRNDYLRRPDAGRRLNDASTAVLQAQPPAAYPALTIVIADGLAAAAVERHAVPLLQALQPRLVGWNWGPIVVAQQARVALGDEIGERQGAEQVVVLIGERPGLSAVDSLGVYLTYAPRVGRMDAERNCISNIRPEGLSYEPAAHRLAFLLTAARRLRRTGISLKDNSDELLVPPAGG